jgi:N-acetyl-gamma-glutamyl-phosphate reductase
LAIEHIAFDAKSGTSGAGRGIKEMFHHPRRNSSMTAYSVLTHRHEPEILQTLEAVSTVAPSISFVPHLLPISRGIFVTAHVVLNQEVTSDAVDELYRAAYASEAFVRLRSGMPEIADVVGSNFCDIGVSARGRVVVVAAVLDNLVKGMAGQAIQNVNIISGLEETTGLLNAGLGLV